VQYCSLPCGGVGNCKGVDLISVIRASSVTSRFSFVDLFASCVGLESITAPSFCPVCGSLVEPPPCSGFGSSIGPLVVSESEALTVVAFSSWRAALLGSCPPISEDLPSDSISTPHHCHSRSTANAVRRAFSASRYASRAIRSSCTIESLPLPNGPPSLATTQLLAHPQPLDTSLGRH